MSPIDSSGAGSSLRIVHLPAADAIVALVGLERLRVNISSGSIAESPLTTTEIVFVVTPAAKVKVPDWAT